jgi:2-amino-4-hydroxy-6-hydroxymethyldihydropteridine diphosphokinase
MTSPRLCGLGLGSNLGDRLKTITDACGKLADLPQTRLLAVSSVLETEPVDPPPGIECPPFLNAVALIETTLAPVELLRATQAIEQHFFRERSVPNAPRTLDIDILFMGNLTLDTPELTLPHPRAHLRRFVLVPLAELVPDFVLPNQTKSVAQLLNQS